MHTSLLQRTISKVFPNSAVAAAVEIIFLLGLGMLAIVLHAKLRIPMHLPGKQGLLFVALIVTGKGLSRFPFAATLSGIGAATLLLMPGLGFHDPFMAIMYLFLGLIMDLSTEIASKFTSRTWILAMVCGACWIFIPLFRLTMSIFVDMPLGAFRSGYLYPFATHLVFGVAGGLAAAGLLKLADKKS
jgi:hypothetical protein